mgnify:CR=1 FL=1
MVQEILKVQILGLHLLFSGKRFLVFSFNFLSLSVISVQEIVESVNSWESELFGKLEHEDILILNAVEFIHLLEDDLESLLEV